MTGLDYAVFLIVAFAAIGGFFRGFTEEVLALAAWCIALFALHYFHEPLTVRITPYVDSETGAGVLAFALLMLVPFAVTRIIARSAGRASRESVLGPIDRILGFGFGAVKGFIIVVLAFAIIVFGYDLVWGAQGRPLWISQARTYPFLNAASEELMTMIAQRRQDALRGEAPEAAAKKKHAD
ncbi:MAG: CvpA family protein [Sphingomonadales bacterium]|nr:CvpA family protein [Sphingomonadales bacterium]MDE2570198.1 CvpA family protein [Sphingomonadales bacterium]